MNEQILKILNEGTPSEQKALFLFTKNDSTDLIRKKFVIWSRWFFPKFFPSKDAIFHKAMDYGKINVYIGNEKEFLNIAFRGSAKRQPLDAELLTLEGFKKLGELNVGDFVIGSDGKPTKILFMSEIVNRPIYKIRTSDGRETECDLEHLWTVRMTSGAKEKYRTVNTQYLLNHGLFYNRIDKRNGHSYKEFKFTLDNVMPIEFKEKNLILEPYLVGLLLGDGSMGKQWGGARLHFHLKDEKHYRQQLKNYSLSETKLKNENNGRFGILGIGKKIIDLGMNVNCYKKEIPKEYLFGSIKQRKALLEGLMDTDGTVCSGTASFTSVSEKLADGVVFLVRSLGGKAKKTKNNWGGFSSFRISIIFSDYTPFSLERKKKLHKINPNSYSRIISIDLVGNKLGRCIGVENKNGLYVTDDFILTHNSTRTKLFSAFCIANDIEHFRRYIKVLSKDSDNSGQFVTDTYNLLISPRIKALYPEIFEKTDSKREERMTSFTTATGVKMTADTVGTDQRGDIQDAYRPDFIIYEDIETRKSLMSATTTHSIWLNMEEARNGLAKDGGSLYLANYVSERGNVHKLVQSISNKLITPIAEKRNGVWVPTWQERYTREEVEEIEKKCRMTSEGDFEGEYLCKPSASKDTYFDRERVDRQIPKEPIEIIGGLKIFRKYDPSHRIGSGHDVGGGVGLDSSTSVFIDYDQFPMQVLATYRNNEIKPDVFAYEIKRQADRFGQNYVGVEKNYGSTIDILKTIYPTSKIHQTQRSDEKIKYVNATEYGWTTNFYTKNTMLQALARAIENGHIELNDPDLIAEARSYSTGDLMDDEVDVRLTTRHFDLLLACAIALQMNPFVKEAQVSRIISEFEFKNRVTGETPNVAE